MDQDTKAAFAKLTKTVEAGFVAVAEDVNFIKDHMLTKEEGVTKEELPEVVRSVMREELKPIEDRLTSVENKIAGTNRRLDEEAMHRTDLAIPKRVSDLEDETFGASRHPQHLPLK
jgi:hypothetical protein